MYFAGLQKNSLIDYPGKVACVLFVSGCNFTCPFCHNPALARGEYPQRLDLEDIEAFIKPRSRLLDGVVITGGEPTLSPGLADLCRLVRQWGLRVKLDTNGSRPDVLAQLIDAQLVDYVAMDIKTRPDDYAPVLATHKACAGLKESIGLLMKAGGPEYEFRTTCVRPFVDEQIITDIGRTIQGAKRYALQSFRSTDLLEPDFFQGTDPGFSPEEMARLKAAASPWVQEVLVRGAA